MAIVIQAEVMFTRRQLTEPKVLCCADSVSYRGLKHAMIDLVTEWIHIYIYRYLVVWNMLWHYRQPENCMVGGGIIEENCYGKQRHMFSQPQKWILIAKCKFMMTSSNRNIFHVTGPFLKGIYRWPVKSLHKGKWRGVLMLFFFRLNKRLSEPPRRRWFETPLRSWWRHCNV